MRRLETVELNIIAESIREVMSDEGAFEIENDFDEDTEILQITAETLNYVPLALFAEIDKRTSRIRTVYQLKVEFPPYLRTDAAIGLLTVNTKGRTFLQYDEGKGSCRFVMENNADDGKLDALNYKNNFQGFGRCVGAYSRAISDFAAGKMDVFEFVALVENRSEYV